MSTRMYTLPVEQTQWHVPGFGSTTIFNWEYDEGRDKLLGFPDYYVSIYGSDIWNKMDEKDRSQVRLHLDAWRFSQFLHGEQGALICAAKIVQTVPDIDS